MRHRPVRALKWALVPAFALLAVAAIVSASAMPPRVTHLPSSVQGAAATAVVAGRADGVAMARDLARPANGRLSTSGAGASGRGQASGFGVQNAPARQGAGSGGKCPGIVANPAGLCGGITVPPRGLPLIAVCPLGRSLMPSDSAVCGHGFHANDTVLLVAHGSSGTMMWRATADPMGSFVSPIPTGLCRLAPASVLATDMHGDHSNLIAILKTNC